MRIVSRELAVEIAPLGAELQSVTSADGTPWLWNGDPDWWTGRAPLLFPVIGKSPDNAVSIEGKRYPMAPHGFARHSVFDVAAEHADRVTLMLKASDLTRQSFPFNFVLSVHYLVEAMSLLTMVEVANLDDRDMPFGFGFHPAFVWPLPGGAGRRHSLRLADAAEPKFLALDSDGLILPAEHASPFTAGVMTLEPEQFANDALLFPDGVGPGITFAAEHGASVVLSWANLPNFAVWTKPGAPYLCLEPWHGMSARTGAGDAMTARPSPVTLAPGATAKFELRATFNPA
jgi:galactose mutarotase-like enzyme